MKGGWNQKIPSISWNHGRGLSTALYAVTIIILFMMMAMATTAVMIMVMTIDGGGDGDREQARDCRSKETRFRMLVAMSYFARQVLIILSVLLKLYLQSYGSTVKKCTSQLCRR